MRLLGTLMVVGGVATLVWTVVVWQWRDPFTSLYTLYQQQKLDSMYQDRLDSFRAFHLGAKASLVAEQRAVETAAKRYRLGSTQGEPVGRIKVPRLGVNLIMVNGTDHDSLTKGPGRDLRTHMPGEGELVYIAGHRTTYLAPFARIETLRRGDRLTLELPYGTFEYRITGHVIVRADAIGRLRSHGFEQLALQACHPRFFATHRYIAYAKPVRIAPSGGVPYKPHTDGFEAASR